MQIGIVVPDVEAAARIYEDVYGIGGWQIMEMGSENTQDVRLHGRPVEWKAKIAVTMVGSVMWELIQPIDEGDLFGRFLAERCGVGGVHHIAVSTPDFRRVVQEQAARSELRRADGTKVKLRRKAFEMLGLFVASSGRKGNANRPRA